MAYVSHLEDEVHKLFEVLKKWETMAGAIDDEGGKGKALQREIHEYIGHFKYYGVGRHVKKHWS